ncbi:thioredoxin domain-containing protein [Shewanella eurypsychrophilus]|uniref:Thioredoxin domain-containing protein n=1 Tax=Shewanella eurypsychrophilus TaxID=2593656 RepID=A0ABX6V1W3_9GAMM|nr:MULTISPECIES: thioredoxin domain-containing protein [Shewanella]QFU21297.1 thioredoxin domain-containing protein [Shewanella sp. YLB-09]QPG56588.1 thioredoxin domain-containing protein [Shewanella eurypsychrophilus]
MKTSLTTLAAALFMTFAVSAAEVILIDTPALDNTVQKVYSVYCPFCYKYEKAVTPNLIKNLPASAKFQAICLENKGELGIESCEVLAAADTISHKKYKQAKMAMYAAIHDKKLKNVKGSKAVKGELAAIGLKAAGISQAEFESALNSSKAQEKLAYDRTIALTIAKLKGIPAIVVGGNKMIDTSTITSLANLDETIKNNL